MKSKIISTNLIFPKFVLLIVGLFLIATTIKGIWSSNHDIENVSTIALGLVMVALSIYLFTWPKRVAFDDAYLYISVGQQIKQIPLENIYKVKLILSTILGPARFVWKIGYTDNAERKTIRILPDAGNKNFEEFKKKIKAKNPSVQLNTRSHSFDFDQ